MNQATISGNIGTAEYKTTNSGIGYISGSIATSYSKKKDNGEWETVTTWHNVKIWRPSKYVQDNFTKGNKALVVGRIENTEYEGKRYSTIVADVVEVFKHTKGDAMTTKDEQPEYKATETEDLPF